MSVIGFKEDPSALVVGASQLNVATPVPAAGPVTVSVVVAETFPDAHVIMVVPPPTAVASPFDPAALLIVATSVVAELQVTAAVRSCVVLLENEPVAVNS